MITNSRSRWMLISAVFFLAAAWATVAVLTRHPLWLTAHEND